MGTGELIVTQFTGPFRSDYHTNLFRLNDDSQKSENRRQRKEKGQSPPVIISGKRTEFTLTMMIDLNNTKQIQVHSMDPKFTLI